jgi:hypothetical protein
MPPPSPEVTGAPYHPLQNPYLTEALAAPILVFVDAMLNTRLA